LIYAKEYEMEKYSKIPFKLKWREIVEILLQGYPIKIVMDKAIYKKIVLEF
jgi:hypothetical protein